MTDRLVEREGASIPRLWLSSSGEAVELQRDDSHGMSVALDPERFGLPAGHFDGHLASLEDADQDVDFDFDTAIHLAQSTGWARISRDATSGVAVGASDVRGARMAVRHLLALGAEMDRVEVEIGSIVNGSIVAFFHSIDAAEIALFARYGRLPPGRRSEMFVSVPELIDVGMHAAPKM